MALLPKPDLGYRPVISEGTVFFRGVQLGNYNTVRNNCKIGQPVGDYNVKSTITGDNVVIDNNVTIYEGAVIGDNVVIGANSTIYDTVVLEDDVVVGASVTINKDSTIEATTEISSGAVIAEGATVTPSTFIPSPSDANATKEFIHTIGDGTPFVIDLTSEGNADGKIDRIVNVYDAVTNQKLIGIDVVCALNQITVDLGAVDIGVKVLYEVFPG